MKELIALYRESPTGFVLLVFVLMAMGSGGTMLSGFALGNDQLQEAKNYTDEKVKSLSDEMTEGFKESKCGRLDMDKYIRSRDLWSLEEAEQQSPNQDRRNQIRQLKDQLKSIDKQLGEHCGR